MSGPTTLPSDPFGEYVPSAGDPWDLRKAGHLLRRTAFGANDLRLATTLSKSPKQAIADLFDFDPKQDPLNDLLEQLQGFVTFKDIKAAQEWWFYRMLYTTRPLQERVALFWHGRLTSSAGKVDSANLMSGQIDLYRQQGLGSFRDLLAEAGQDPAMLIWLDGQYNRKGKPNENYAREVMELFSLGIGTYTEDDVKQLARAFTGWQVRGGRAVFNKGLFDDGTKHIFGQAGDFDSESAVDLILRQPSASPFLSGHLLREFVHPDPSDEMVKHYADRLLVTKWDLKGVLREMLSSRLFFSDWAYRSRIKSPVELAVGAVTALGGKVNTSFLREQTAKMGQNLLFPPNVKGWDGGEEWINANTVLLRFNFGEALATQRNGEFARKSDMEKWLLQNGIKTSGDIVDHYAKLLLDGNLSGNVRAELVKYMDHGTKNEPKPFVLEKDSLNDKVRGLLHLLMAMPEFQLA